MIIHETMLEMYVIELIMNLVKAHTFSFMYICDWLWENPPETHKDNYLEKHN